MWASRSIYIQETRCILGHLSLGPFMLLLSVSESISGLFQLHFIPLQGLHKFVFQPCISGQFITKRLTLSNNLLHVDVQQTPVVQNSRFTLKNDYFAQDNDFDVASHSWLQTFTQL